LGLVIVDRSKFDEACLKHLESTQGFRLLPVAHVPQDTFRELIEVLQTMMSYQSFPLFIRKYLENYRASKEFATFYMIPKVHKPTLAWRPIIPATGTWNACIAKVVDHYLQPIVKETPSYVQDSTSLIQALESKVIPGHLQPHETCFFVTADVESLYTNIPLDEAWNVTRGAIMNTSFSFKNCLNLMCRHVLFNNTFKFNGKAYIQVDGVATGSPLAPSVANLFMHSLEIDVIRKWDSLILLYRRYIDDLFILFKGSEQDLNKFIEDMNNLHNNIRLTWKVDQNQAEFLDLVIFKGPRWPNQVDYRIHQKALNSYLYLPWTSFHPMASKLSFITAELLRYARNCSQKTDYLQVKRKFGMRLKHRGYPVQVINKAFNLIKYSKRYDQIFKQKNNAENLTASAPLVFKTRYDSITRTIRWGTLLNPKPLLPEPTRVITAFKRSNNLFEIFKKELMTSNLK
jgi:hypothetical protein